MMTLDQISYSIGSNDAWPQPVKGSVTARAHNPGHITHSVLNKKTRKWVKINHSAYPGRLLDLEAEVGGRFMHFSLISAGVAQYISYVMRAAFGKHAAYGSSPTLGSFISGYAPKSDSNNTDRYISSVASKLGVRPTVSLRSIVTTPPLFKKMSDGFFASEASIKPMSVDNWIAAWIIFSSAYSRKNGEWLGVSSLPTHLRSEWVLDAVIMAGLTPDALDLNQFDVDEELLKRFNEIWKPIGFDIPDLTTNEIRIPNVPSRPLEPQPSSPPQPRSPRFPGLSIPILAAAMVATDPANALRASQSMGQGDFTPLLPVIENGSSPDPTGVTDGVETARYSGLMQPQLVGDMPILNWGRLRIPGTMDNLARGGLFIPKVLDAEFNTHPLRDLARAICESTPDQLYMVSSVVRSFRGTPREATGTHTQGISIDIAPIMSLSHPKRSDGVSPNLCDNLRLAAHLAKLAEQLEGNVIPGAICLEDDHYHIDGRTREIVVLFWVQRHESYNNTIRRERRGKQLFKVNSDGTVFKVDGRTAFMTPPSFDASGYLMRLNDIK